jgi:uncharacterized glyoxalase superfamily protein PhnB
MKRVTGIGAIFFKSNDQEKLYHRTKSMINYRVDDLDALIRALKEEGVEMDPHREDYDYGRFRWVLAPTGTASSYGNH